MNITEKLLWFNLQPGRVGSKKFLATSGQDLRIRHGAKRVECRIALMKCVRLVDLTVVPKRIGLNGLNASKFLVSWQLT